MTDDHITITPTTPRAARLRADNPCRKRAKAHCAACKGSGLNPNTTSFEVDEFNPKGYWAEDPCEECGSTGLAPHLVEQQVDLQLVRMALDASNEQTAEAAKLVDELLELIQTGPVGGPAEDTDKLVDQLADGLDELARKLDPGTYEG